MNTDTVVNEEVWTIKDFVEKANAMHLAKFPDDVEVHRNSIDKWFKELEEKGVHYVQRSPIRADWKIYDDVDLNIALYIMEMRSKTKGQGWQVSAIYNVIPRECNVRPFPKDYESQSLPATEVIGKITEELKEELKNQVTRAMQDIEKNRQLLLESDLKASEDRMKQTTKQAMVSLFERQMKLKKEAAAEWEKLPEEKRFIKKLFRKEEKLKEREAFIEDYVEKNMWKELAIDNAEND